MRIKFEVEGKEFIKEISDEEIEKRLEENKKAREQKEINETGLVDLKGAASDLEDQLRDLKNKIIDVDEKIKAFQEKIDEPI